MSNPNLQQDIEALLSRASQELEIITTSERLALDPDLKVSIAIFSYLLCTVLDQLWSALSLKYGVVIEKAEYYPCLTEENPKKNIETVLAKNKISSESKIGQTIKESQPYLKSSEEDKWLKHLRYFRNFNSHSELSTGEQYAEFNFITEDTESILNISYRELKGKVIEIKNAYAFFNRCFEETKQIFMVIMDEVIS